jgi:hypothetical protein
MEENLPFFPIHFYFQFLSRFSYDFMWDVQISVISHDFEFKKLNKNKVKN